MGRGLQVFVCLENDAMEMSESDMLWSLDDDICEFRRLFFRPRPKDRNKRSCFGHEGTDGLEVREIFVDQE